jgi:DNA-binding MarR family transcriptional regulator
VRDVVVNPDSNQTAIEVRPGWLPNDPRRMPIAGDLIGQSLQMIAILTRRIEERLGVSLGINLTDLSAMEQLIASGPLTPTELAARLKVSTAASSHVVDRLEAAGHVKRERRTDDRRKVLVVPAPAAVERTFQQLAPMLNGLNTVVAELSGDDRVVVERFLGRVLDVYQASANPSFDQSSQ